MFTIKKTTDSKYQMIANNLKSQILQGNYLVDQSIPSENQLQKEFEVSRHTVREAIALLVNEGYLRKEKGSGTYVSNHYQQKNKTQGKKTIGVIITYLADYIFPAIIRGLEQELSLAGYSLMLASTNNDVELERKSLELMLENGVDGLIVEPTKSNQFNPNLSYYLAFQERGIPFVMINAKYEELNTAAISLDDQAAGFIATNHLLTLGHKKISLITKIDDLQGKKRMTGFIQAHGEAGLVFKSDHLLTYETETLSTALEQVAQLMMLPVAERPTAFVCYNEQLALAVIDLLKEKKLLVPNDISIVSYDDSFLSTATEVKLTTIIHPQEQLGRDAARGIINAVERRTPVAEIIYPAHLVIRESTAKI